VLAARLTTYGGALGDPTRRDGAVAAFHDTFLAAALLDLLALGAATLLSDRLAAATMRGGAASATKEEMVGGVPVLVTE
jgi:hypothetical protein